MGALDKLETLGVLAVLAGGAYLILTRWGNITESLCRLPLASTVFGSEMCPEGDNTDPITWECPAGTVLENGICKPVNVPPIVLPKDEHGCLIASQKWCETEQRCRDAAQYCAPAGGNADPCMEWSPLFGKWLYSPNKAGCTPYYEQPIVQPKPCNAQNGMGGDYITCDDGTTQVCDIMDCPPITPIYRPTIQKCECGDGGIAFAKSIFDCANACASRVALPSNCRQVHDACAPLQIGAGGGYGFIPGICPSQYPIELAPGVCINERQAEYTQCMGGCAR